MPIKKVIDGGRIPVKIWTEDIDQSAIEQLINLSNLPFAVSHIAAMSDAHSGYGMPIGGVIACKDVIIPNAVGVDIACGMIAVETSLSSIGESLLKNIMGKIRETIPVGFKHHTTPQEGMPLMKGYPGSLKIVNEEYPSAMKQLGTLGGGNHFWEVQQSAEHVWIMIHSGSRNIGLKVATFYNNLAEEKNKMWYSLSTKELAFLPLDSAEGKAYLEEMTYCLEFAKASRKLMMSRSMNIFNEITGCSFKEPLDVHHNYARMENHHGYNVMVHRKGATSARLGELGIIPGSQGTSSYIVRGKGNKASFESCSHGAGRRMGRKEACRSLNLEAEKKLLDDQGILHSIRGRDDLEEAASAYKNIDVVMEEQKDLVEVVVKLKPLGVIKG